MTQLYLILPYFDHYIDFKTQPALIFLISLAFLAFKLSLFQLKIIDLTSLFCPPAFVLAFNSARWPLLGL